MGTNVLILECTGCIPETKKAMCLEEVRKEKSRGRSDDQITEDLECLGEKLDLMGIC